MCVLFFCFSTFWWIKLIIRTNSRLEKAAIAKRYNFEAARRHAALTFWLLPLIMCHMLRSTRAKVYQTFLDRGWRIFAPKAPRVWGLRGLCPFPIFLFFFHFKIAHSAAFSYINSKVLFAIKCRERYVIMVFLAIDSDTVFINLVNPVQSVISNSRRFHSYRRHCVIGLKSWAANASCTVVLPVVCSGLNRWGMSLYTVP